MTSAELATEYVLAGWSVTPVRGKRAILTGWQELRIPVEDIPKHFKNGENVGGILGEASQGRVDVDLDCREAVEVASRFLPATWAVFGRKSNPSSHRIYRTSGAEYLKLADPTIPEEDHATIVELRQDRKQTVLPGSTHPSGERIEWEKDGEPARVEARGLERAVLRLGACVLLARHYPPRGLRHDFSLHLAGALVRAAWEKDEAEHFIGEVARLARDEEAADREAAVETTLRKIERGEPVTGFRSLAKMLDPEVARRVAEWLGLRADVEASSDAHATELGLAQRIAAQHADRIRYCWPWSSWLVWDGTRWARDREGEVVALGKETVHDLYRKAAAEPDEDARKKAVSYALRCEKESVLRAGLSLARTEPGIPVLPEGVDQDTFTLNTPSGVVDLRTGELRPHRREDLFTRLCPITFDPDATGPTWERFLLRIFAEDLPMVLYVQRLFGYAATGCVREHVLPILWGSGANGKSTLTTAILDTLGPDYAGGVAPSLLSAERKDTHPTALANLFGKRVAVTHETDSGSRLAEGVVKQATGGDRLTARRMREDFWEFTPTHTLFLATNSKPVVRGTDDGIWRRLRLIPFKVQIPAAEQDRTLGDRLRTEAPAILAWLVAGARDWYQHGLGEPEAVVEATQTYRGESDLIGEFLASRCVVESRAAVKAKDLYETFATWHREEVGGDPPTQTTFGRRLSDRGFDRHRTPTGYVWRGLRLSGGLV